LTRHPAQPNFAGYASTPTIVASFTGASGGFPGGSFIVDANGDLFGTTTGGDGAVFEIAKTATGYASTPTTLVSFNGANGALPGALIVDANGDLFGTTSAGGANGYGTVFEIAKTATGYAGTPTIVASLTGAKGTFPRGPIHSMIADADGDLFGTTKSGGATGHGTVFEIVNNGTDAAPSYASTPTTLARFNSANGAHPRDLIADANGDLFGTTNGGRGTGKNTVFEIVNNGTVDSPSYARTPTILASYSNYFRLGKLIIDPNGDLFGSYSHFFLSYYDTVFEIAKTATGYASTSTDLVEFRLTSVSLSFADVNGNVFGTTNSGGANGDGSVFEIVAPPPPPVIVAHPNDISQSGDVTGPDNFIDLLNLEASYPDLINAFGTDQQAMQNWFNTYEPTEQRADTFDGLDYIASYSDLVDAFKSAGSEQAVLDAGATHYIEYGYNEGRTTTFNSLDYIASYGDLIDAFGVNGDAGAYHYIEYGETEGRATTFDGLDYIASYKDLIKAFGANEQDGAEHFIQYGYNEGRTTTFHGLDYIAGYTDLMEAFGADNDAGATHYIDYGLKEGRVAAPFNVAAYESAHPDLIGAYANNGAFLTAYIDTYKATGHYLT
jgi:uncharacterized repeat protein (TIGR03803 family)